MPLSLASGLISPKISSKSSTAHKLGTSPILSKLLISSRKLSLTI